MNRYIIELSEEQLQLVADCIEDVSRFASGQMRMEHTIENMLEYATFDQMIERRGDAEELLERVKRVLLPEMLPNESYGYNSTEFIGNTYQIYRTIRHKLMVDRVNEGVLSNNGNVYMYPALPSGTMGEVVVKKIT